MTEQSAKSKNHLIFSVKFQQNVHILDNFDLDKTIKNLISRRNSSEWLILRLRPNLRPALNGYIPAHAVHLYAPPHFDTRTKRVESTGESDRFPIPRERHGEGRRTMLASVQPLRAPRRALLCSRLPLVSVLLWGTVMIIW